MRRLRCLPRFVLRCPLLRCGAVLACLVLCLGCGEDRAALLTEAQSLIDANQLQQAQAVYETLLARDPRDLEAIQGMIDATRRAPNSPQHVHWCERLLKFRPWDYYANLAAGRHEMREGRYADAANRLVLALMDAEFQAERRDVLAAIQQLRAKSQQSNEESPSTP